MIVGVRCNEQTSESTLNGRSLTISDEIIKLKRKEKEKIT